MEGEAMPEDVNLKEGETVTGSLEVKEANAELKEEGQVVTMEVPGVEKEVAKEEKKETHNNDTVPIDEAKVEEIFKEKEEKKDRVILGLSDLDKRESEKDRQATPKGNKRSTDLDSPRVFVSLKDVFAKPTINFESPSSHFESTYKTPVLQSANSLSERNFRTGVKLDILRLRKKAKDLAALQTSPTINSHSKKLAKASLYVSPVSPIQVNDSLNSIDDSFYKVLASKPSEDAPSPKNLQSKSEHNFDNSVAIVDALKLRSGLASKPETTPKAKAAFVKRSQNFSEKKNNKIKQALSKRKAKEMEECTFRPSLDKKKLSKDFSLLKRSLSGPELSRLNMTSSLKIDPEAKLQKHLFEENFSLTQVKLENFIYSQVSPATYYVKHHHGFDVAALKAKSQPMLDYRHMGKLIESNP